MRNLPLCFLICVVSSAATADDWNQFRGNRAGKLRAVRHPIAWSATSNVAWAVPVAGSGWSSPVVVGDRVFLTSAVSEEGTKPKGMAAGVASMRNFRSIKPSNHKFVVSCLSLQTGKQVWSNVVGERVPPVVHPSNTYATESPATDGQRLFTFFASTGTLTAWDLNGEELWRKELGSYKSGNGFGSGSSLAIANRRVFVQYDNDESSFVAAFASETGEQVWRDDGRPAKTSWSTPLIWNNAKRTELIACGSKVVTSYDPATGKLVWRLNGMESGFSGSPAIGQNGIYFGNSGPSSSGPLVGISAGVEGDFSLDSQFKSDKIAWSRTRSGPGMASPVVAKGLLYIPGSGGILSCYDTSNGERVYRIRVPNMSTVVASLWADDDRVFILDEDGTTHIIQAGPEFLLLGANKLNDLFWSTPAIAGDTLLLRGVEKLYCIRKAAQ